jgi:hypothetical protein
VKHHVIDTNQQGQERDFAKWLVDYDTVVVARASADSASRSSCWGDSNVPASAVVSSAWSVAA